MIWTDTYLNQLAVDAEQQINQDIQVIWCKFYLNTIAGQSVYTLPSYVRTISRITWLGRGIDAVNWEELQLLAPASVFISTGNTDNVEVSQGKPLYYCMHPTHPYDIKFHPTPNLSCGQGTDPYSPDSGNFCIVSAWRSTDPTLSDPTAMLPKYVDRRLRKAYILWRAFSSEGEGQNLNAAAYYKSKYDFIIDKFRHINEYGYFGKRYALDDGVLTVDGFRYPKPTLPSQFERVLY